jgi:hypothetical protein
LNLRFFTASAGGGRYRAQALAACQHRSLGNPLVSDE